MVAEREKGINWEIGVDIYYIYVCTYTTMYKTRTYCIAQETMLNTL